jgi:probable HAF family extracellular repeat protein
MARDYGTPSRDAKPALAVCRDRCERGPIDRQTRRLHRGADLAAKRAVKYLVIALIMLALTTLAPRAQDAVFFMPLPPEALAVDVGANAFSVIGSFYDGRGLSWMPTTGVRELGGIAGRAISLDGRTLIGDALDSRRLVNAAIWRGGGDWRVLGSIRPDAQGCDNLLSSAYGASDDGKVIVGLAWDGCRIARAFRWDERTGVVDLGTTNANSTRANNVSGDGRVVVGWQEHETGPRLGAKWVDRQQETIRNAAGRQAGEANAANRDGSIIVGHNCDLFNPSPIHPDRNAAWRWTSSGGTVCFPVRRPSNLPDLPYITMMLDTSDTGGVIGGSYTFGLDAEALIWLDGGEGVFLKDYLIANGQPDAFRGWVNTGFITGVSPDGRTLVGYGAGPRTFQGYVVLLPERGDR